ncbi:hypothetical protein AKO1_010308 [Acrasis kona]|uniref:Protein kinase domain-containing protein n=1 Tax=Acrasis kona TaxID=1008807 RepID=A0AAW2ZR27_9EUKA
MGILPLKFNSGSGQHSFELNVGLVVTGSTSVGKTSFVRRMVSGAYNDHVAPTICADYASKDILYNNTLFHFGITDIAGQNRFSSVSKMYYTGASIAILMYDVSRYDTYNSLKNWIEELRSNTVLPDGSPLPIILVSNKNDLQPEVSRDLATKFAIENDILEFVEVSIKEGTNVRLLQEKIARVAFELKVVDNATLNTPTSATSYVSPNPIQNALLPNIVIASVKESIQKQPLTIMAILRSNRSRKRVAVRVSLTHHHSSNYLEIQNTTSRSMFFRPTAKVVPVSNIKGVLYDPDVMSVKCVGKIEYIYLKFHSQNDFSSFLYGLAALNLLISKQDLSTTSDMIDTFNRRLQVYDPVGERIDLTKHYEMLRESNNMNLRSILKNYPFVLLSCLDAVRWTPRVHSLDIGDNNITDQMLKVICDCIKDNLFLTKLYLNSNSISHVGCYYLSEYLSDPKCTLTILSLSDNPAITNVGFSMLFSSLQNNKSIQSLHMEHNGIDDAAIHKIHGMCVLGRTPAITSGRSINLTDNNISINCESQIVDISRKCPWLELVLTQNPINRATRYRVSIAEANLLSIIVKREWHIMRRDVNIQSIIARGNQATVFQGVYQGIHPVAIKQFDMWRTDVHHLESEVSALLNIRHPNCLNCFGVCVEQDDRNVMLVMEYMPMTLGHYLHKFINKKLSVTQKLQLAIKIASGMYYLHSHNPQIIHLDLKTDNVLVNDDLSVVKIADFGMSKTLSSINYLGNFSCGTAQYQDPLMYLGKVQSLTLCDVYSFGIILYEIWYQRIPYENGSEIPQMLVSSVATENLRPWTRDPLIMTSENHATDKAMNELILSCCAADTCRRPDSFESVCSKLRSIFDELTKSNCP